MTQRRFVLSGCAPPHIFPSSVHVAPVCSMGEFLYSHLVFVWFNSRPSVFSCLTIDTVSLATVISSEKKKAPTMLRCRSSTKTEYQSVVERGRRDW